MKLGEALRQVKTMIDINVEAWVENESGKSRKKYDYNRFGYCTKKFRL